MEIFRSNIYFTQWGEIYAGLKKQWITTEAVFSFCNEGKVKCCNDERLVELYLAMDESLFEFYKQIKSFIVEDNDLPILKNEDESERDFHYIPDEYWEVWKLEFLLRIKINNHSLKEKLDEISKYHRIFDYPKEWNQFIYYQPTKANQALGQDQVYLRFLNYVEEQKIKLK